MTLLRHRMLSAEDLPLAGIVASVARYDDHEMLPGTYRRSRVYTAVSGDDGWLEWNLPTATDTATPIYVVRGIEAHPVLAEVAVDMVFATVTQTRIGILTSQDNGKRVGTDLVTEAELAQRFIAFAESLITDDASKEQFIPARLSTDQLAALLPRSEGMSRDTIFLDARDHGVTGDGVTDDTAALQALIYSLPEGWEVFLRPGTYLISAPLVLRRNRSIRGVSSGLWPYDTGGPTRIKAASNFVGDAIVRFRDEEELYGSVGAAANGLYVGPNDQSGMGLVKVTLDGFNVTPAGGGIDGIKASGLVRSVRLDQVSVRRCTGSSFHTVSYTRADTLSYYPRGWRLTGCTSDTAGNNGFSLNLLNDSTLIDCLAVNSASHGFYIAGPGELLMVGCRSVFNKARGYYLTGTSYGNVVLSACSTDRNEQSGVYIDCTRQPIILSGCTLRRDGRNGNGGGGGYAGLLVNGATAPVIVSGLTTETGQDDNATGTMSPQYGVRAVNSTSVTVDSGVAWGNTAAISDGGGNTNFRVSPRVLLMTGSPNAPVLAYQPDTGPFPTPADHNLAAWTFDPALAINTSSAALTSGVEFQARIRLTVPTTISNVLLAISAAGAGLVAGQSFVGLRNAAGTLLGVSTDQAAAFAVTGNKTIPLTPTSAGSLTLLPAGSYYISVLSVGTTMPTLLRAASQSIVNVGLAAGAFRFATLGAGLTALPAAPALSGQAANSTALWAAVS